MLCSALKGYSKPAILESLLSVVGCQEDSKADEEAAPKKAEDLPKLEL